MHPSFVADFASAAFAVHLAASFHIRTSRDMNAGAAGPPLLQGRQGTGRRCPRARQAGQDGTALWMTRALQLSWYNNSALLRLLFTFRFALSCGHQSGLLV